MLQTLTIYTPGLTVLNTSYSIVTQNILYSGSMLQRQKNWKAVSNTSIQYHQCRYQRTSRVSSWSKLTNAATDGRHEKWKLLAALRILSLTNQNVLYGVPCKEG